MAISYAKRHSLTDPPRPIVQGEDQIVGRTNTDLLHGSKVARIKSTRPRSVELPAPPRVTPLPQSIGATSFAGLPVPEKDGFGLGLLVGVIASIVLFWLPLLVWMHA